MDARLLVILTAGITGLMVPTVTVGEHGRRCPRARWATAGGHRRRRTTPAGSGYTAPVAELPLVVFGNARGMK
jgi:hypothetical protein